MNGPVGTRPLTHAEKALIETAARLDTANQALRSLRKLVKEQHAQIELLAAENGALQIQLDFHKAMTQRAETLTAEVKVGSGG